MKLLRFGVVAVIVLLALVVHNCNAYVRKTPQRVRNNERPKGPQDAIRDPIRQRPPTEAFLPMVWYAPLLSSSGYGSEAMEYVLTLDTLINKQHKGGAIANFMVMHHGDEPSYDAVSTFSEETKEKLMSLLPLGDIPSGVVAVCHSEPGAWSLPQSLYPTERCPPKWAQLSIGRTMFETDRLPKDWSNRINRLSEVWVPSEFHKKIFIEGGCDANRVYVIPESLDTQGTWNPERIAPFSLRSGNEDEITDEETDSFAASMGDFFFRSTRDDDFSWVRRECGFLFLSVFKWEERKGWDVLLKAFFEQFIAMEPPEAERGKKWRHPACLLIKTSGYHSDVPDGDDEEYIDRVGSYLKKVYGKNPQYKDSLQQFLKESESGNSAVHIISSHIPSPIYPKFIGSVDCIVQPSRGEGWGRPHSEGMAMKRPVIATNWSGNTAFMRDGNSLLVKVARMSEVKKGAFKGHRWAEPSVAHLKQQMKYVFDNTEISDDVNVQPKMSPTLRAMVENARRTMVEEFDAVKIGVMILDRVNELLSPIVENRRAMGNRREDL